MLDSWWWTVKLSETCRVLFQKWNWDISASPWFYYKNNHHQALNMSSPCTEMSAWWWLPVTETCSSFTLLNILLCFDWMTLYLAQITYIDHEESLLICSKQQSEFRKLGTMWCWFNRVITNDPNNTSNWSEAVKTQWLQYTKPVVTLKILHFATHNTSVLFDSHTEKR